MTCDKCSKLPPSDPSIGHCGDWMEFYRSYYGDSGWRFFLMSNHVSIEANSLFTLWTMIQSVAEIDPPLADRYRALAKARNMDVRQRDGPQGRGGVRRRSACEAERRGTSTELRRLLGGGADADMCRALVLDYIRNEQARMELEKPWP